MVCGVYRPARSISCACKEGYTREAGSKPIIFIQVRLLNSISQRENNQAVDFLSPTGHSDSIPGCIDEGAILGKIIATDATDLNFHDYSPACTKSFVSYRINY